MSDDKGKKKKGKGKSENVDGDETTTTTTTTSTSNKKDDDDVQLVVENCTECDPASGECDPLSFQFQHSKTGVPVTNRRYHLKLYPTVFTGYDAVTWLCGRLRISRPDAVVEAQKLMDEGLFTHCTGKEMPFSDSHLFFRFAKHDLSKRIKPADVDSSKTFHLSVSGFKGCPFCKRAIDAAEALAAEVGGDVLVVDAKEHDNRQLFNSFLSDLRKELSQVTPAAAYHTTSPIVWITDTKHYIGGLDDMLVFLSALPMFQSTKTMRSYKPESAVSTFFKGIPTIAKNWKSTLPF